MRQAGEAQAGTDQFTIDPFKSRAKLEVYRLARPELCVLPLVSAAILNGAMVVDVDGCFENLSLRFDGRIWTHEDFPELLSSKSEEAREFQVGLSAAQALQPQTIRLLTRKGRQLSVLEIVDGRPSFHNAQLEESGEDCNQLEIKNCQHRSQADLYKLLQERCCFSPKVAWRGHRLIRKSPPSTAARLELKEPDLAQPAVVVSAWVSLKISGLGCSGHVWTTDNHVNLFTFVIRGIAYKKDIKLGAFRGFHGVIHDPNLNLDLSRSGIVEDEDYRNLLTRLQDCISSKLMPVVKREIRGMLPDRRKTAEKFLRQWGRF